MGVSAGHLASPVRQVIRLAHGAEPCRGTRGPEASRGAEFRIGVQSPGLMRASSADNSRIRRAIPCTM